MNAAARGGREVQRHIINRGEGERRGEGVGVVNEWRSEGVEEWRRGVEEERSGGVEEWRSEGVKE